MRMTDSDKRALMSPIEQRAHDRQSQAAAAYDRIDRDPSRTGEWKREAKIREWATTRRDLDAIRLEEAKAAETRRQSLQRSLFGLPASASANDVLAYRDATERAGRIDSEAEAVRLMHNARDVGDNQIVRAIAARAVQAGWTRLVDAYAVDIDPAAAPKIAELTQPALNATREFNHAAYFLTPPPTGLETMSEAQLQSEVWKLDAADGTVDTYAEPGKDAAVSMLDALFRDLDSSRSTGRADMGLQAGDDSYYEAS